MRAVVRDRYGAPDVLRVAEVVTPTPNASEVLVRVHAASVNDWDWALIRGEVTNRLMQGLVRPRVRILGGDLAGRVESVGAEVTGFAPGDAVYGDLCMAGFGTFADYVCAPASCLCRIPAGMTFEQAAAIPQAGMLAVQGLFDVGGLTDATESVLLNGAGGGVGTFALQLARSRGVEATCVDRADKLRFLEDLGANHVIDYRVEDFTRDGRRYDLILDARTTRTGGDYVRALNPGGTYATVGGEISKLLRLGVRGRVKTERDGRRLRIVSLRPNRDLAFVNDEFGAGRLVPVIDHVFPLEEARAAFRRFADSNHVGKIVMTTGAD